MVLQNLFPHVVAYCRALYEGGLVSPFAVQPAFTAATVVT